MKELSYRTSLRAAGTGGAKRLLLAVCFVSLALLLSGCGLFGRGNKDEGGGGSSAGGPPEPMGCVAGTVDCGGACVATLSDPYHCGMCGNACASGQYCEAGACISFCSNGETDCGGVCQLSVSDPLNCGGCALACQAGQFCDRSVCSATCSGTVCTTALGAQQCAHLDSNNDNCGACGVVCPNGMECQGGICQEACPPGRAACGAGCVDIRSNAQNCGGCGVICQPGQTCSEGQCGGVPVCNGGACSCSTGQEYCNESCVDPQTNILHCGACGIECLEGQQCSGGICSCALGTTLCGGACTDTRLDSENCGACGTICSGGTTCQGSVCACAVGQELCGETCIDPQADANNCGGCGIICAGHEACVAGICKYEGDQCGGDAREIAISRVSMYQAVELDLFNEGQLVPAAERTVDVIENRAAMVRVFVTPTASFLARTLSARLFVENEGEDIQVFHHKKNVSVPSSQSNLDTTFQLDLPAEVLKASTKFWIELVECGDLPAGEVRTVRVPTTPGENGDFSARETGVIKVVFVPVTHDGRTPDVSESTIAAYAREVERMYPTTGVEWSVRDPITSNQSGVDINLEATLNLVTDLRYVDGEAGVPDDVYYYGLIDPASSFNDYCSFSCTTGVAWVLEEGGFWQGSDRAGVGIGFGTDGVATFAHELGHNHGRDHAPCNVGGDANYPYGGGSIGVWGYDLLEQELKDPAEYADFMGYCNSNWVSDYSYNAYTDRVASANGVSEGFQSLVRLSEVALWYRMVVTETDTRWLPPVERRGVPGKSGETASIYDSAGNVIDTVEVHRVRMSHGDGFMLYVPEPRSGWFSVGVAGGPILVF